MQQSNASTSNHATRNTHSQDTTATNPSGKFVNYKRLACYEHCPGTFGYTLVYQMVMTPIIYTPENKINYDNEALQNVTKEYSQQDAILSQSNTEPINFQIIYFFKYLTMIEKFWSKIITYRLTILTQLQPHEHHFTEHHYLNIIALLYSRLISFCTFSCYYVRCLLAHCDMCSDSKCS